MKKFPLIQLSARERRILRQAEAIHFRIATLVHRAGATRVSVMSTVTASPLRGVAAFYTVRRGMWASEGDDASGASLGMALRELATLPVPLPAQYREFKVF